MKVALVGGMLFATMGLTACGGEGADGGSAWNKKGKWGPAANENDKWGSGNVIRVEGASRSVLSKDGKLTVLWPLTPSSNYGMLQGSFTSGMVDASTLQQAAPGAYKTLGDRAALLSGTITDLAGNGEYAMGRWANGNLSNGEHYTVSQGRAWAVGTPVKVDFSRKPVFACKLHAATRPVAVDGNTPPGAVAAATAKVYVGEGPGIDPVYDLSLSYNIGSDKAQTMTASAVSLGLVSDTVKKHTLQASFLGADALRPYLAVAYTMQAPTVGTIHGLAMMACSRS
jgi:hypothetical protein